MLFVKAARARSHLEVDNARRSRSVEALDVKDGLGVPVDAQFTSLFDRDVERLRDALREGCFVHRSVFGPSCIEEDVHFQDERREEFNGVQPADIL